MGSSKLLRIIGENKDIIEVSNNIICLKFFKNGKNKGKFEINFIETQCSIKDCFSVINFFDEEKDILLAYNSNDYRFKNEVINIQDILGKGVKIIFEAITNQNQNLFFKIQFKIYENTNFILIKIIDIKDNNQKPLAVHSISPLTIKNSNLWLSGTNNPSNLNNITWFKNGWQSWSPCKILFGQEKDDKGPIIELFNIVYDIQDYKIEGRFYSEYCTAITDLQSFNSLILGFVSLQDQFSRIIMDYDNPIDLKLLTAIGCMDGVKFNESSINSSEELFICLKTENRGYYGLIDYSKVIRSNIKEKRITDVPIGWCSWYYYFTEVTQEDMIKNIDFFKNFKDILPIDFIQLDDGYFTKIGDYNQINSKFSNGLDWLFNRIKENGFKGGIWTGPFIGVRKSDIFQNHKDWFVRDVKTNKLIKTLFNWAAFEYTLDLSNKEVINYLSIFFKNLLFAFKNNENNTKDQLIQFFKIDFLHSATPINGNYKNKTLTRAQLYYDGIKAIRNAITDKSFLLGCGAPLGPCVGVVDAMRISYDTGPLWDDLEKDNERKGVSLPCLKVALLNILYRSFMHKHWWINDPDCLMLRRSETKLNDDEIKLQITVFGLSGGQILVSDDMTKLTTEEINDAKLTIPPYNPEGYDPILVDAFTSKLPSIYMLETNEAIGKRYLTLIVNWDDNLISKSLPITELIPNLDINEKSFLIYDFWNQKLLGKFNRNDNLEIKEIKPHGCYYLSIIPLEADSENNPLILSTNLHISQGCCEIKNFEYKKNQNKLIINLELIGQREGVLLLKLPKKVKISKYNFKYLKIDNDKNIWELNVKFKDKILLEVELLVN